VLYDPEGLSRSELIRLASTRKMVRNFNKSKLGKNGFYVDVEAIGVTLPDGTVVPSGLEFRNSFHVSQYAVADLFVPCGGRPGAINLTNVDLLFDPETKRPHWKYIVEGANLFITQEARLILEERGVVLVKDSSANKGGVTSSSLEVLAALSLNDEEFETHMTVVLGKVTPKFYQDYVKDVHRIIEENSRLEFESVWAEHLKTKEPMSTISDMLSEKINAVSLSISSAELFQNKALRDRILQDAIPPTLQQLVGLETMLQRVPESYMRALFSAYLSSRYVYHCGMAETPEAAFFEFVTNLVNVRR